MMRLTVVLASISVGAMASAVAAQTGPAPVAAPASPNGAQPPEDDANTIVVTGQRLEGAVIGDVPAEVTFSPADIRSFGVSSISDLLAELAPQTGSTQGRGGEGPVVLLGGKRISSFAEIRDIPTEAIQRVEILPEEVALKYGYRANQKVVNIVLRRRFRAFTGELEAAAPTQGGQFSPETDNSFFRIGDAGRLNLAVKYQHSSALTESERDIIQQTPTQPFDVAGNITSATSGAVIDPGLTALLGRSATVIGVPAAAASRPLTLADFAGASTNVTDTGRFRTLLPETDALTVNAVLARTIFKDVSASFNGTLTYNESDSTQGLAGARLTLPAGSPFSPFVGDTTIYRYLGEFGALDQHSRDVTGHVGATLSGAVGRWNWTFTGNYDHTDSRTTTDRGFDLAAVQTRITALDPLLNPFAALTSGQVGALVDRARSISNVGDATLVVTGSLFTLPAGPATTTISLGGTTSDLDSRSTRSGLVASADLSRQTGSGQVSLDLPIASRKRGVLSALGELTANLNARYDRFSDFGGLRTIGVGANWTPIRQVSLIASLSKDEGAPTIQQLGNPLVATTGVRVFDFVRGETIDITRLTGGNATLSADDRRIIKLGMTLKPLTGTDLSVTANYTNSRIRNPIASFPTATAAIEAAFPSRFTRDAAGRLLQIDSRPINFARQDQEDFRWGINFSKQLSSPPRPAAGEREREREGQQPNLRDLLPPGQTAPQASATRQTGEQGAQGDRGGTGGGPGGPGGGPGGPGGPGGGPGGPGGPGGFGRGLGGRGTRLQLAIYHTVHLQERIVVADGGPVLDLLNGDAITSSGGQPRHEVQAQAGLTHNGFGARLSANWQSGTTVNGGVAGAQTLRFSDLTTVNLRLFANLGQQQALTAKWPFLRGSRLSLSVTNLFNQRLDVRDAAGATPISYQPAYLDPLGRSVRISFRKLFF
ncbi:TonB-dependent receptor [Sphingomonas aquatilis]|uniref:TonB-dependent receptor n=1 Tax=Sphingomonas aquatilis TaxID=93063 RepID=UPI0023F7354C|nr:TonB-dependent receptor [Sphingomonas aquatilis]MCI4654905.1 TonB-dependent receptor [Sphingomonas aquatilis]